MILANEHNDDEMMREIEIFKDIRHNTSVHITINTIYLIYNDHILYCYQIASSFLKHPIKLCQ